MNRSDISVIWKGFILINKNTLLSYIAVPFVTAAAVTPVAIATLDSFLLGVNTGIFSSSAPILFKLVPFSCFLFLYRLYAHIKAASIKKNKMITMTITATAHPANFLL